MKKYAFLAVIFLLFLPEAARANILHIGAGGGYAHSSKVYEHQGKLYAPGAHHAMLDLTVDLALPKIKLGFDLFINLSEGPYFNPHLKVFLSNIGALTSYIEGTLALRGFSNDNDVGGGMALGLFLDIYGPLAVEAKGGAFVFKEDIPTDNSKYSIPSFMIIPNVTVNLVYKLF